MDNYKARMQEEHNELVERYEKLKHFLRDYELGRLDFEVKAPDLLYEQLHIMFKYLAILEGRMEVEGIEFLPY